MGVHFFNNSAGRSACEVTLYFCFFLHPKKKNRMVGAVPHVQPGWLKHPICCNLDLCFSDFEPYFATEVRLLQLAGGAVPEPSSGQDQSANQHRL